MKKLTLSAEPEVVEMAKQIAEARGTSVSAMFSQFIRALAENPISAKKVGPITRRLTGIVKQQQNKNDRELLEEALIERHSS